jgi:HPt (histidine-containing phosphotransfer) domain-containing protein
MSGGPADAPPVGPPVDLAVRAELLEVLGDDGFDELVSTFVAHTAAALAAAGAAARAGDLPAVRAAAHQLRSSAGQVGAAGLAAHLLRAQRAAEGLDREGALAAIEACDAELARAGAALGR